MSLITEAMLTTAMAAADEAMEGGNLDDVVLAALESVEHEMSLIANRELYAARLDLLKASAEIRQLKDELTALKATK